MKFALEFDYSQVDQHLAAAEDSEFGIYIDVTDLVAAANKIKSRIAHHRKSDPTAYRNIRVYRQPDFPSRLVLLKVSPDAA